MGLPERDHADIRRKVILAVSTDKAVKGRNAEHIAAFKELSDFLTAEVAARRANPTDDLITHLAEAEIDGDRLSEREIVLTTATFVMAGVESLSSFMSMFALNLHDHPDARRRVVADPALIAPAIEESLRFNTSAQRFKRTVMRETDLHGQKHARRRQGRARFRLGQSRLAEIPRSGRATTSSGARKAISASASGKHFCLGSQMARLVTEVAMRRFLDRVPEYHLTVDRARLELVVEFPQPRRAALRNATEPASAIYITISSIATARRASRSLSRSQHLPCAFAHKPHRNAAQRSR